MMALSSIDEKMPSIQMVTICLQRDFLNGSFHIHQYPVGVEMCCQSNELPIALSLLNIRLLVLYWGYIQKEMNNNNVFQHYNIEPD